MKQILIGDCIEKLKEMPDASVNCIVTSPPYYGLRDYGVTEQIGLEETPEEYINKLVEVFRECRRVLTDDGTLWVNIGDSYAAQRGGTYQPAESLAGGIHGKTIDGGITNRGRSANYNPTRNASAIGLKHKDLIGIPWLLAFALRSDGWFLRQDIIWSKPNPMPESVRDRCTKSHEYIFFLTKNSRYWFDHDAIQEDSDPKYISRYNYGFNSGKQQESFRPNGATNTEGLKNYTGKRNKRDVWTVTVKGIKEAHFATFPEKLIEPCILAGCPRGGVVLDPFCGSGTTGIVSVRNERNFIGIELNPEYAEMSERRITKEEQQGIQISLEV